MPWHYIGQDFVTTMRVEFSRRCANWSWYDIEVPRERVQSTRQGVFSRYFNITSQSVCATTHEVKRSSVSRVPVTTHVSPRSVSVLERVMAEAGCFRMYSWNMPSVLSVFPAYGIRETVSHLNARCTWPRKGKLRNSRLGIKCTSVQQRKTRADR